MINTVLMDLDDTILDFHASEATAISNTLQQLDIEPTSERVHLYSDINDMHWKLLEKGVLTREEVLTDRFDAFFKRIGVERSVPQARALYEKMLSQSYILIAGAKKLLENLSACYDLYIVSNGTAWIQNSRIEGADIKRYFKDIFISQNIGANKPSVQFFKFCFSQIPHFENSKTVIIGDSLSSDISGGIAAGIHTLWFNPHKNPTRDGISPEYVTDKLEKIPAILLKI